MLDGLQFLTVRQVVNSVNEGSTGTYGFCNRTIGQQHKLFNQMMGFVGMLEIDLGRMSVLVQSEPHFVLFDGERTVSDSFCSEFGGKAVEDADRLLENRTYARHRLDSILSR